MEQLLENSTNTTNPNPNNDRLLQLDWGIIDGLLSAGDIEASSSSSNNMAVGSSGIIHREEMMNSRPEDHDQIILRKLLCGGSKSTRKPAPTTKQKIAFRTRSSEDVLDDGFRWRKYGHKSVKNSVYPRNYYRCAQHTCNVKKQVQRLSEEPSTVLTTYDGRHNHLPHHLMETLVPLLTQLQFLSRF